jgi:hypothetical protein
MNGYVSDIDSDVGLAEDAIQDATNLVNSVLDAYNNYENDSYAAAFSSGISAFRAVTDLAKTLEDLLDDDDAEDIEEAAEDVAEGVLDVAAPEVAALWDLVSGVEDAAMLLDRANDCIDYLEDDDEVSNAGEYLGKALYWLKKLISDNPADLY